ncbi:MAG: helix-turn-helix domain-containing protein [Nitrososphaerales archaeon]
MVKDVIKRVEDPRIRHLLSIPPLELTEYEVKALLSLVEGPKSPSEISEFTGIPRSKSYEILSSLLEKGLIEKRSDKPLSFKLNPNTLANLENSIDESYKTMKKFLREFKEIYKMGKKELIKKELEPILLKLGFSDLEWSELFLKAKSTQFKSLIFVYDIDSLNKLKIKELQYDYLIVIGREIKEKYNIPRMFFISQENLENSILTALEEIEEFEGKIIDRENRFSHICRILESQYSELRTHLRFVERDLEGLREGDKEEFVGVKRELKEEVESLFYDFNNFKVLFEETLRNIKEGMHFGKEAVLRLDKYLDALFSFENRIRELKDRIDSFLGRLKDLKGYVKSLSIVPPEKPSLDDIINQRELLDSLDRFVRDNLSLRNLNFGFLIGDYGSGKTLVMKYLTQKINTSYKKETLACYITPKDNFISSYNAFIDVLSSELSKFDLPWPLTLEKQKTFFGSLRHFGDLMFELIDRLAFKRIFWLIDEFDRVFALDAKDKTLFIRELKAFLDTYNDLSLSILMALTKKNFSELKAYEDVLSRLQPSNIFLIKPFEREEIKEFLVSKAKIKSLSEEDIKEILSYTQGNPRRLIHFVNHLFSLSRDKEINSSLLSEALAPLKEKERVLT